VILLASQKLEQELLSARNGDRGAREKLIQEHRDFIAGTSSKICRRYLVWDNDDELSIALLAFNEAAKKIISVHYFNVKVNLAFRQHTGKTRRGRSWQLQANSKPCIFKADNLSILSP
jgi:DNA-directed RNA polymerase specialized sigma subunit